MELLIEWLIKNVTTFVDHIQQGLIEVVNWVIEAFSLLVESALGLLPDFTLDTCTQYFNVFENTNTAMPKVAQCFNFFFPMDVLIMVIGCWLTSEVTYIVVAPVLRWFKLIAR